MTSTVRGLSIEVADGLVNGLDQESLVNLGFGRHGPRDSLIRPMGVLLDSQERDLARAFHAAIHLEAYLRLRHPIRPRSPRSARQ